MIKSLSSTHHEHFIDRSLGRTLGARLGQVFAKRHPLKPERKERKRIAGQVFTLFLEDFALYYEISDK